MDLDPLVSVDGLGEAIKLWQVAFLERAMNAADLASTAMIASSTEATACSSALMEALLDKMRYLLPTWDLPTDANLCASS